MAMQSAYSVWIKRPLAAVYRGAMPAEYPSLEGSWGHAVDSLNNPLLEQPLAIYTDWDVVAIRMQAIDIAAAVGFARTDQLCLAAIMSGLARQLRDTETPGSVLMMSVNERKRGIAVQAERFAIRRPLSRPVLLRGQQLLDDVLIREEQDGISVAFAKWLPTGAPALSVSPNGRAFARDSSPTVWPEHQHATPPSWPRRVAGMSVSLATLPLAA